MARNKKLPISLLFLGFLVFGLSLPASAYYPPLQQVEAWVDGLTVHYRAFDPIQGQWVEGTSTGSNWTAIPELKIQAGIVAWSYERPYAQYNGVGAVVYDPGRGSWQQIFTHELDDRLGVLSFFTVQDGILAVKKGGWFWCATYDPIEGNWKSFKTYLYSFETGGQFQYKVSSGVVAFADTYAFNNYYVYVYSLIYDPRAGWRGMQVGYFASEGDPLPWPTITSLDITNGTVSWEVNGVPYTRGYDPDTRQWYEGPSKPLAYFVAQQGIGLPLPIAIRFTDVSLGATSWTWNFGDGSSSSNERSPSHAFANGGVFMVTQTVTGPNGNSASSQNITVDATPPTGSININGGASYTNTRSASLTLSATDLENPITLMRFSNDVADPAAWSTWKPYATSYSPWTLTSGDGKKDVAVQFRDAAGVISDTYSNSIILDTWRPYPCYIKINADAAATNTTNVTLALSADPGTGSPVTHMRFSNNVDDPNSWSAWKPYATSFSPWYLTAGDGQKQVNVQFQDAAGNVAIAADNIFLDANAPATGSIVINAGAVYTKYPGVTLALQATDATTWIKYMRFKQYDLVNETPWGAWMAYVESKNFTLLTGDSRKWVEVQFQDAAGNVSNVFSDTIILDTIPPEDGTLTALAGDRKVSLNWQGFTDSLSGIQSYQLYYSNTTYPTPINGTKIYDGPGISYVDTTLTPGKTHYYRLCAVDLAGNVSEGATALAIMEVDSKVYLPFLPLLLSDN